MSFRKYKLKRLQVQGRDEGSWSLFHMDVCILKGKKGLWLISQSCLHDRQSGARVGHEGVTVPGVTCALGPGLECFLLFPGYLFVGLYLVPRFKSVMV